MIKPVVMIAMSALVFGCATPYQKHGISGGYEDSRIDENTFSISVQANGMTKRQAVSNYALYRAAELTIENGFDFFVIINNESGAESGAIIMSGASTSKTAPVGNGSTARTKTTTTYSPGIVVPVSRPSTTLMIKAFKGDKPADAPSAFDARSVIKNLAPQVG